MKRAMALGAAVLAAMAVGRAITDLVPVDGGVATPFFHDAGVGDTISLDMAEVTISRARVSPTVSGNPAAKAGGRWLIVDAQLKATREPITLFATLIDAAGRHHFTTDRAQDCVTNGALPTALTWSGSFCFDVEKSALDGATLLVHRGDFGDEGDGFRRDDVARIDLGTDNTDTLWAQTATVDVKPSDIVRDGVTS